MDEAFASEGAGYIAHALGVVSRAKGMTDIARQTGLSREQLYRSFSGNGNPTLKTTLSVMKALGLRIALQPSAGDHAERTGPQKSPARRPGFEGVY